MKKFYLWASCFVSLSLWAQLTPQQALEDMGRGINLGNTLEAPNEGDWAPKAQSYFFDDFKEAGFSTVRIPVRWYTHTGATAPYKISETWMTRVETVVDWALDRGFYVIINCHHSSPIKEDYDGQKARWDSIWVQVSQRFQHKSENLFFEMMNEPQGWTVAQANDYNKRVLSIIRKTNPTRIVLYSGNNWTAAGDLTNPALQVPDPNDHYLMGTYHSYDPWSFGGQGKGTWGTSQDKWAIANTFQNVAKWSKAKNIPVIIGEFGSTYVNDDGGESDLNSRYRHYACFVENALKNKVAFTVWDDNGWFQVYIRNSRKWKEWKDILIHYSPQSTTDFLAEIQDDSTVLLTWKNQAAMYDSITVERKRLNGSYSNIATLMPGAKTYIDSSLSVGYEYLYRLITHQKDTAASWGYPQKVFTKPAVRSPFNGQPFEIPGTVEAEEFDNGVDGLTFHDMTIGNEGKAFRLDVDVDIEARNDGGYQVGWIDSAEWIEYSIDIKETKNYDVTFYVASQPGGGKFRLLFEKGKTTTWDVPVTGGWQENTTVMKTLRLPKGQQIMRVEVSKGGFNIDKILFTKEGETALETIRADRVQVYPNPSKGSIQIHSGNFEYSVLQVIDLRGTVLYQQKYALAEKVRGVHFNLESGTYLLRLSNAQQGITQKITIY